MCKQNMTNTSTKLKCWSHACDSSPYGLLFFPSLWIFTSVVITISASELHSSDSCVKWIPFLRFVFFFLVLNSFIALVRAKKESKDASHICTTISMLLTKHLRWLLLLSLFNLTFSIQWMWYNEHCEMGGNGHWTHCEEYYSFRIIFFTIDSSLCGMHVVSNFRCVQRPKRMKQIKNLIDEWIIFDLKDDYEEYALIESNCRNIWPSNVQS